MTIRYLLPILTLLAALPANAVNLTGIPRIVDGDTVEIAGTKIRLDGIDAPETDQVCLDPAGQKWACGIAARDELIAHAGGKPWACRAKEKDRYGRTIADCYIGNEDVDAWMVRKGWALAFVRYSHVYVAQERAAQDAQEGLWSGAFIAPWDWRSRNQHTIIHGALSVPLDAQRMLLSAVSAESAPSPDCAIKGNLQSKGGCIYHLPGGRSYPKLDMMRPGRRWFCTTKEAQAAGCRAAIR